jgi:hypothetical protein
VHKDGFNQFDKPMGYAQLTSIDTSTLLSSATFGSAATAGLPSGAIAAIFIAETQNLRFRDDGVAPTTSVGMPLYVGVPFYYTGDLTKVRIISQVAGGKLNASTYGNQ